MNTSTTVVQWEYTAEANYSKFPSKKTLDIFGDEGWELVAIIQPIDNTANWILYFKRPKTNTNEQG